MVKDPTANTAVREEEAAALLHQDDGEVTWKGNQS